MCQRRMLSRLIRGDNSSFHVDKTTLAEAGGCVPDIMCGLQGLKGAMEASFVTGIMGLWSESIWGQFGDLPSHHRGTVGMLSPQPPCSQAAPPFWGCEYLKGSICSAGSWFGSSPQFWFSKLGWKRGCFPAHTPPQDSEAAPGSSC